MGIATLQDLLGPVPEAEFRDRLRRRELAFWRGSGSERLAPLIDWGVLERLLETGRFPARCLRITRRGTPVPATFFTRDGRADPNCIRQLLPQGVSLIFSPLDGHLPTVDALLSSVRGTTGDRLQGGAIATTGTGGALAIHYDVDDILIVQLEGTKRWRVHRLPVVHPVHGMSAPDPPVAGDALEQTLEPGDLLFLPAGHWHQCENGPGRSVHFGLSFFPPSVASAADSVRRRLLADPAARAPLTRDGAAALDEAAIRARLIEEISRMSLADFFGGED